MEESKFMGIFLVRSVGYTLFFHCVIRRSSFRYRLWRPFIRRSFYNNLTVGHNNGLFFTIRIHNEFHIFAVIISFHSRRLMQDISLARYQVCICRNPEFTAVICYPLGYLICFCIRVGMVCIRLFLRSFIYRQSRTRQAYAILVNFLDDHVERCILHDDSIICHIKFCTDTFCDDISICIDGVAVFINRNIHLSVLVGAVRLDGDCGHVSVLVKEDLCALCIDVMGLGHVAFCIHGKLDIRASRICGRGF